MEDAHEEVENPQVASDESIIIIAFLATITNEVSTVPCRSFTFRRGSIVGVGFVGIGNDADVLTGCTGNTGDNSVSKGHHVVTKRLDGRCRSIIIIAVVVIIIILILLVIAAALTVEIDDCCTLILSHA